jgi:hypothetical protein
MTKRESKRKSSRSASSKSKRESKRKSSRSASSKSKRASKRKSSRSASSGRERSDQVPSKSKRASKRRSIRRKSKRKSLYHKTRKSSSRGTGYKNRQMAKNTIRTLQSKPKKHQIWTINTLYYRAKFHPYQTDEMCDAMVIFEKWLDKNVGTCSRSRVKDKK